MADIFHQQPRLLVRLHEKGGEFHQIPCHHTLEGYLAEYLERRLAEAGRHRLQPARRWMDGVALERLTARRNRRYQFAPRQAESLLGSAMSRQPDSRPVLTLHARKPSDFQLREE